MDNKEMTVEEAVELLEECMTLDDTMYAYNKYYMQALEMAIKELKKQIKLQPIVWNNPPCGPDWSDDDWGYECPCCGNQDLDEYDNQNTCKCGQHLDWNFLYENHYKEDGENKIKPKEIDIDDAFLVDI